METSVKQRLIEFIRYKGIGQGKFEKAVGLSNGYLNQLRHSPSTDKLKMILNTYPEINDIWLLTGKGEMLNDKQENANEPVAGDLSDYETWLLPQTAHGGSLTNIPADGVLLQNCERIVSPIKDVDFAVSVYGESMAPEYPSGSRVLIKKINHNAFIDWGRAYVLDTCNCVILKEVLKCEREGFVTCHSINPDPKYADFDVSMDEIYGIYRVLMCLSAK